jgi:hypothetical protein
MRVLLRAGLLLLLTFGGATGTQAAQEEREAPQAEAPALADSAFAQPPISKGGAFFRSFLIPGWAQAELGAEARGAGYFFVWTFSLFMVARTQYRIDHAQRNDRADLVDARNQQREDWLALAIFTAFFSAADGWISVHLYGFDERTGVRPEGVALGVQFRWPVGP